ncbi:hypothetical protein HAZT_HAZT000959 [Hyalella azteca]|uniref:Calponin-homology (CH) domain-containing protein n=1 Tax=Hyalella azteca TaxID=294128 RepID=A0A6A0GXY1_HYAAZ|nr:hypothetical protein HAZT_HAZT000959 [Hyalella azteca]
MADFESGRIKQLRDEQRDTQKKSFTKWVNDHLGVYSQSVEDVFEDLKDGLVLRSLLEIISGEELPKLNKGNSKVHNVSNVSVSFDFLRRQNMKLVGIGPEDIADGVPDLVLGLTWSIIHKYHINQIEIAFVSTTI